MSSQSDRGIPFSVAEVQQNVRLLELPPDLLELLTRPNPPNLGPDSSSSANLSEDGICAIATCPTTLEAIPAPPSHRTALSHLQSVLRPWNGPDDPSTLAGSAPVTKRPALFADIPVSEGECATAWNQLCAFEDAQGHCWVPTPTAQIGTWTSLLRWMVAQGWDMRTTCQTWEARKSARLGRMLGEVEREEGWPAGLARAVLRRVGELEENENPELERKSGKEVVGAAMVRLLTDDIGVKIDPEVLVYWTGKTLLAAKTSASDVISTEEFMQWWRDALPEPWVEKASLNKIEGSFVNPSPSMIRYSRGGPTSVAASASASGGKAGSRKWHDKFKQKRK
ncbi:MAG: hypothetical protein Q9165_001011 [Trypethelium subeluteriae]